MLEPFDKTPLNDLPFDELYAIVRTNRAACRVVDRIEGIEVAECNGIKVMNIKQVPIHQIYMSEKNYNNEIHELRFRNNHLAKDPSWETLRTFLTNNFFMKNSLYRKGDFMCGDYSMVLHNMAEAAGIRCAHCGIHFINDEGHAVNAFNTTDCGLIIVDACSGYSYSEKNFFGKGEKYTPDMVTVQFNCDNPMSTRKQLQWLFLVDVDTFKLWW